jgi:hypothetical protein
MTPYEFALYCEAYSENKEADMKERLTLVWLGEYYHRIKELKKISGESQKVMSNDEMLEMVKRLNQQFGGKVIKGGE